MTVDKKKLTLVVSTCNAEDLSIHDRREASLQHENFRRVLRTAGAQVMEVPLIPDNLDSVFVKDSALLKRDHQGLYAYMAHPKHQERREEQDHRRKELESLGFEIKGYSVPFFEGGDLEVLPQKNKAILGYGFRSDLSCIPGIENFLGIEVVPLELKDKNLFHLDLACAILGDGTAIACEDAFTPDSWRLLTHLPDFKRVIPVSLGAAYSFGLNWVEIENTVVMGDSVSEVILELELLGKNVIVTSLDCFHKSSGSAACLSARVHNMVSGNESPEDPISR